MGQSKNRLNNMLQDNPFCIFCGGQVFATTIDHVPPKIMFTSKSLRRPKGLEFPACADCNRGSSKLDNILGLFTRFHSIEEGNEAYRRDLAKIIQSVASNSPELFNELQNNKPLGEGAIISVGPLMHQALKKIGAKIGLALHYEKTKSIISMEGGVLTIPIFNYEVMQNGLPSELEDFFPHEKTLEQGKVSVQDQFTYATLYESNNKISAHWVTFRQSFGLQLFVVENLDKLNLDYKDHFVRPGLFQENVSYGLSLCPHN